MFKGVNKVIRIYIYWDIVINSAWGLLGPVFAIFILQTIAVGDVANGVKIAGFASLSYWAVKSILQIPIGRYLDKNHGEKDDFWFFVIGVFLTGLVPFGFLISFLPIHVYLLQILHAIGMSMVVPSSWAIFIRHIDKGREAYESSLDSTLLGIGVGITGALGGIMAAYIGFQAIFILTGTLTMISVFLIFLIRKDMRPKDGQLHEIPPSRPF
ncbi:MFS transporter [Patescibacteria group bacterium]|nr:MFS transporter [Patescibacteria group bacterium]